MVTQLNIKDRETVGLAKRLAARRKMPVTRLVHEALQREEQALEAIEEAERMARVKKWEAAFAEIDEIMEPLRIRAKELGMTSDHRWIYEDEDGNPLW